MSSMTDIVFLLLIFFMLASTLVTTNAIDILLPKANGKTEKIGLFKNPTIYPGSQIIVTEKPAKTNDLVFFKSK